MEPFSGRRCLLRGLAGVSRARVRVESLQGASAIGAALPYDPTMAACQFCNSEMNGSLGCVEVPVRLKAGVFAPIPWLTTDATQAVASVRCHDCDALPGNYHHRGCDEERCPNCDGQLISVRSAPALSQGLWSENHFCNRIPIFTVEQIVNGTEAPIWVVHDHEGDWQVSGEEGFGETGQTVAYMTDISDLNPSLPEVRDLPVGWEAWIDATGTWNRKPLDDDGDR